MRRFIVLAGFLIFAGSVFLSVRVASTAALSPALTPADISQYRASVEEGRYLAKAGNCAACHTTDGGKPFAGGVEFRTPFGVLYSTNITTDPATGIGAWTFEDFYRSMKLGVRPDGSHLYPAFPYTDFARMTDEDIASLYLFMQTIEPVAAMKAWGCRWQAVRSCRRRILRR